MKSRLEVIRGISEANSGGKQLFRRMGILARRFDCRTRMSNLLVCWKFREVSRYENGDDLTSLRVQIAPTAVVSIDKLLTLEYPGSGTYRTEASSRCEPAG